MTNQNFTGSLLTTTSAKIQHSNEFGSDYYTAIMYLAPFDLSGRNVCAFASSGCAAGCLNTAGRGKFDNIQKARINRTNFFFEHKAMFKDQLFTEIFKHQKKSWKNDLMPAVRLNGTSDLVWEYIYPDLFTEFSDIIFYDYTKYPINKRTRLPQNYDLTFSRSESNHDQVLPNLEAGRRVAVVFDTKKGQPLPAEYLGYPVVDGDLHDMRFIDPDGVIVGLRAKGLAAKDTSGFVVKAK
tara:strand:- start:3316 stop:4032 length:717 start_codon:yes stop_codon:yes gene_type:complete